MSRHISPTITGAIIIGRLNIVLKTDIPRIFRSSRYASPTAIIIPKNTTAIEKCRVTGTLSQNAASAQSLV